MLNGLVLGQAALNTKQTFSSVIPPTDILTLKSNSLSLSNDNSGTTSGNRALLQELDVESGPKRLIEQHDVPRGDGVNIDNIYNREWIIRGQGTLFSDSYEDMNAYIETLKKDLQSKNFILDVVREGVLRRFPKTSVMNFGSMFSDRKRYDITRCPFDIRFIAQGLAVDFSYSSQVKTFTSGDDTDSISTSGNAKVKPVFIIVVSAASTMSKLEIENETNGDKIIITRTFAAGEALVIDCEEMTVQVNGVDVDFVGKFPTLEPDSNIIRYTTTSSSHSFDATIKHRNAYI